MCSVILSEAQHANDGGFLSVLFSPFFDMTFHAIFLDPPVKNECQMGNVLDMQMKKIEHNYHNSFH